MSEADRLFEELGYIKVIDRVNACIYENPVNEQEIVFDMLHEKIELKKHTGEEVFNHKIYDIFELDVKILKAIEKKCEEKEWDNAKNKR